MLWFKTEVNQNGQEILEFARIYYTTNGGVKEKFVPFLIRCCVVEAEQAFRESSWHNGGDPSRLIALPL
jgi:hypothetical protein